MRKVKVFNMLWNELLIEDTEYEYEIKAQLKRFEEGLISLSFLAKSLDSIGITILTITDKEIELMF
jgi:hypothetical protein